MKRTLGPIAAGLLMAAFSIQSVAAAPGGGASFTLAPNPLQISSATGWYNSGFALLTTKKTIALTDATVSSPANFNVWPGTGTCGSYGAAGQPVPANTTCTIQVTFHSTTDGTFSAQLSVAECLKWHLSTSGAMACDRAATPQRVSVNGTSLSTPADLRIIGVNTDDHGPIGDADYRIDVVNHGFTIANPGFYIESHWSTDNVLDEADTFAGYYVNVGGVPPNGAGLPVWMTSASAPGPEDQFLIVEVDHGDLVPESDETNNVFVAPLAPH